MTVFDLKKRCLTVFAILACNRTEICPLCISGELSVEVTVFNLEGRSLTVLTLRRLAGVYVADPPVAVIADVRSLAVLTGCLNLCIGCADPPVTVGTDVRNLTCCSNAGIGLADEPVAVIANVRSLTVCTGCLNAGVSALAFTDPPVAVLADVRSQAVGCNCLVLGLFAVEVPVAVCTDVVRKCILNNDHTVACFLGDEASYSKLVAILTSEVNNCLIGIAAEDLTVYGNKLGIDEYIRLSCAFHKKNELLTVCINYAIGYIKSCISINANYCCLTCHANDVSVSDSSIYVCYVNSNRSCDSEVSTINGNVLIDHKHTCIKVCKENNSVTVLCCCVCFLEGCIVNTVYRSNCLYDAECAVTVRNANHVISTVLGNVCCERTAGDELIIKSCSNRISGAVSNVTGELTALNGYANVICRSTEAHKEDNVAGSAVGKLTAGDCKSTLTCNCRAGKVNLNSTNDLAAANCYINSLGSAVCSETDCTIISTVDLTALNNSVNLRCRTPNAGVNSVRISVVCNGRGAKVLNNTTLNDQCTAVSDSVGNIFASVAGIGIADLTTNAAVDDGKYAIILNHAIACGLMLYLTESMTVKVKSNCLSNYKSFAYSDIALKNDCVAVLSNCQSRFKRTVTNIVNCDGRAAAREGRHCGCNRYALYTGSEVLGNILVVYTGRDLKYSVAVCIAGVTVNVTDNVTANDSTCAAYYACITFIVIVPVVDVNSKIILAVAVVNNVTACKSEEAVYTNGYVSVSSNGSLALNSKGLVDTNEEKRIIAISVIGCGRNCVTVKVKYKSTGCRTVVCGLNVEVLRNLDILNERDCVAAYGCIECLLKSLILCVADLGYCNKYSSVISHVAVTAVTGICGIALSLEGRSSYNCIVRVTGSLNLICNVAVATCAGVGCVTACQTGRSSYNCIVVMTLSVNYCLCNENLVTYGAVLTLGKTGLSTCRSYCLVNYDIVTISSNLCLCNENLVTYGAVRAFGLTCFSTCRSYRLVNYDIVTISSNLGLCNENLVTYGAVLTLGLTCLSTCRSYRLVNNLGVTLSVNYCLCNENLVTYETVLTLGKTGLGTCRSLCRINNLGVTECGNNILSLFVETVLTVLTLFKTGCGTCRSLCRVNYESVTVCGNSLLCNGRAIASCTVRSLGLTCLGTCRSNCLVNYDIMSESINNCLCNLVVASCTVLACSKTCVGTCRSYCLVNYDVVTLSVYYCLCNENLVTYGAVLTLGKTGLGTCRSLCRVNNLGVTGSSYGIGGVRITTDTGVSCITVVYAIGCGYNCIIGVSAYCVNAVILNRVIAISYLICIITVNIAVSGVIVYELTAGNKELTSCVAFFILVYVKNEPLAIIAFCSLEATALDIYVRVGFAEDNVAVGCGVVVTTLDEKLRINTAGDNGICSRLVLTTAYNVTLAHDCNGRSVVDVENLNNAVGFPVSLNSLAVKIDCNDSALDINGSSKVDVSIKNYVEAVCNKEYEVSLVRNGNRN